MFQSSDWHSSILASTDEGKRMSDMVEDQSFWTEALMAVKATIPLVEVLKLLDCTNKPQVGFIYDTLDQAKETIKKEFKHKRSHYARFWKAIDDIWDEYLHSHLHAVGYFLNPTLFYSSDFYTDVEVSCGLCCCVVRMIEDRHIQHLITQQIDEYRVGRGTFHLGSFKDKLSNISPGGMLYTFSAILIILTYNSYVNSLLYLPTLNSFYDRGVGKDFQSSDFCLLLSFSLK